jgi:hypothetical protein
LRAKEASTNAQYTMVFSVLPLMVTLPFLWYLALSTSRPMALMCLLSVTSLVSSAYTMYFVPATDPAAGHQQRRPSSRHKNKIPVLNATDTSPVNQYLPYLNAAIASLLVLASLAYRSRTDVPEGLWLFLLLPAAILGMVVLAKRSMTEIQSGLSDLQSMRYEYKGA